MPPTNAEQTASPADSATRPPLRIGVDVGGTFTDLVAFDGSVLQVVKIPSTPPDFHLAVIEAVRRATGIKVALNNVAQPTPAVSSNPIASGTAVPPARQNVLQIVHGSTVATNALLQRAGEPVAFVTTEGFRDMLLIGRQNRPDLYALHVVRPTPLTPEENWFAVRERISARGEVVEPLQEAEVDRLIASIQSRGLRHVAVCLLFSFINPAHERLIARKCEAAGLSVSLSCDVLPEFREYERASTTVINAALRPTVAEYLSALSAGMGDGRDGRGEGADDCKLQIAKCKVQIEGEDRVRNDDPDPAAPQFPLCNLHFAICNPNLRILHSAGGTLSVPEAIKSAARLVLSGPAGGVLGAAFVAKAAGFPDVITYDMGGTSTDVATIQGGRPQWTTATTVDGLPIGLPMFDIHTVGAGGGSVAYLDTGGALRVGPRSAGAMPGPACYGRGGVEPTVTDANLLLGRILPDRFLGGAMRVDPDLARTAIAKLADAMGKDVIATALGIVKVAEANMERAIRAVSSRRGHDPRNFTLVSFGGAGGLHACALADALEIPRVLIPPYCGVLSALGMVVAPPVADASKTVIHLGEELDDSRLPAEFGSISGETIDLIPYEQTAALEAWADVRFRGQSHEIKVRVERPSRQHIEERFVESYRTLYGQAPAGRAIEIVTLRVRRIGRTAEMWLPELHAAEAGSAQVATDMVSEDGPARADVISRANLISRSKSGPLLLVDAEATTYVPPGWQATGQRNGSVVLECRGQRQQTGKGGSAH
jgi:N-methylhydantoinase A